jgi:hypothetical protein
MTYVVLGSLSKAMRAPKVGAVDSSMTSALGSVGGGSRSRNAAT